MFIRMTEAQGDKYRAALETYKTQTGKEPTFLERTDAFRYATSTDGYRPVWF